MNKKKNIGIKIMSVNIGFDNQKSWYLSTQRRRQKDGREPRRTAISVQWQHH